MADHSPSTEKKVVDSSVYNRGIRTGIILFVLTVIEYFAAIYFPQFAVLLILLAAAKAYFVITIFMGLPRLWSEEEH